MFKRNYPFLIGIMGVTFQFQVQAGEEVETLEAKLAPLRENYSLAGNGNILVYEDPSSSKIVITPNHVVMGGSIEKVSLKAEKTPGFLTRATPKFVELHFLDGETLHTYRIEYSANPQAYEYLCGSIGGQIKGEGTAISNTTAGLVTLVSAEPERLTLALKSGFEYTFAFGNKET